VILRSRSTFWCVQGVKHQCGIFHSWVAQCRSHKKRAMTCYAELVFLHHVRSGGHVACFGSSIVQNTEAHFFMLGWARRGAHKKHAATSYVDLVFWHHVRSGSHVAHFGVSRVRNIDALFSFSSAPCSGSQEARRNTLC
jgi:hypothetical protein